MPCHQCKGALESGCNCFVCGVLLCPGAKCGIIDGRDEDGYPSRMKCFSHPADPAEEVVIEVHDRKFSLTQEFLNLERLSLHVELDCNGCPTG